MGAYVLRNAMTEAQQLREQRQTATEYAQSSHRIVTFDLDQIKQSQTQSQSQLEYETYQKRHVRVVEELDLIFTLEEEQSQQNNLRNVNG